MKQIVLLIYIVLTIFIIQCTSLVIPDTMSSYNDIIIDNLAKVSNISRNDIVDCYNKANIEPMTEMSYKKWIQYDILDKYITNTEEIGLKIGCLNACLMQKSSPDVHPDRYLDLMESEIKTNPYLISHLTSDARNQLLDCYKQLPTRNECEMHYEAMLCLRYLSQQLRYGMLNYYA